MDLNIAVFALLCCIAFGAGELEAAAMKKRRTKERQQHKDIMERLTGRIEECEFYSYGEIDRTKES